MMTAETTSFFMLEELLAGNGIVRETASRLNERISQFLNFDENFGIQRIVIWRLHCLRRCISEACMMRVLRVHMLIRLPRRAVSAGEWRRDMRETITRL